MKVALSDSLLASERENRARETLLRSMLPKTFIHNLRNGNTGLGNIRWPGSIIEDAGTGQSNGRPIVGLLKPEVPRTGYSNGGVFGPPGSTQRRSIPALSKHEVPGPGQSHGGPHRGCRSTSFPARVNPTVDPVKRGCRSSSVPQGLLQAADSGRSFRNPRPPRVNPTAVHTGVVEA